MVISTEEIDSLETRAEIDKLMKLISNYINLLFLVISLTTSAQEYVLNLKVIDGSDQRPLEGVSIYIKQCGCGGITNNNGIFSKKIKESNYDINIDYLGYASEVISVILSKNQNLIVSMKVEEQELSEVVLLAQKRFQNTENAQMGIIELNSRDLIKVPAALGEFDVLKSLSLMAGVNNTGDVSNGVSIRGGSLDQNLLLYDSAPVFNPTHLFGLFSVFTPDVISSVNIYRANIPSKFGGRIASVLGVNVKTPYIDKFKLDGGIGLVSSRLTISTPLIKDKLMLTSGGRYGLSGLLFPLIVPRLKNTRANFNDSTSKLLYILNSNNQFTFTNFFSNDFYQLDLISSVENIISSSNQYDFRTLNNTLKWIHTFNNNTNLSGTLVHSTYKPKNLFPEIDSENLIRFESQINYSSIQMEYINKTKDKFDYYLGSQLNRYDINPGILDPGFGNNINPVILNREKGFELSLYGNLNWNINSDITLSTGLRITRFMLYGPYKESLYNNFGQAIDLRFYNDNELVTNYTNPEPRLGINYKLNDKSSIKISYARLFQYIQNIYNTNTPLPTSRWKISDRYISPQKNDTYGLGYYKNFPNSFIELSLESYYRDTKNNLTYKPGADFFLSEFIEREITQVQGRSYGVELSLKKTLGQFNGVLNYSWSRSLLKSNEINPQYKINNNNWFNSDFDRPHTVNLSINFENDKYNSFSFNFVGQSGRPYTIANGIFEKQNVVIPIYLIRNNSRLPTYHRLDFAWKISYSKDPNKNFKGDWIFTIYNLYGRKNPFNIYYTQRNGTIDGDVFLSSPLGSYELSVLRSPLVSLTYNFRFQ